MFLVKSFTKMPISKSHVRTLVIDFKEHFVQQPEVHLLDSKPNQTAELTRDQGLDLYKKMHLVRHAEETCAKLYREKFIRGFCHLYLGQEAVAIGMNSVLNPEDTVITSYRCHAWYILLTDDLVSFFAELLGNSLGCSRGKGGSMHLYAKNFYGGNGIVGGHVPLGVGVALTHKYLDSKAISVTAFGDGAFNQGQAWEAFNIAKLRNLPVMFVVENNHYAMGTSTTRSSANDHYYRSCSWIPGVRVNGMHVLAVIEATKFAINHIREGKGPIILEMMTYRYRGHSMSDPGTSYRDRSEIQKVRDEIDCIKILVNLLTESKLATSEELAKIQEENKVRIAKDLAKAEKGAPVGLEELCADIYTSYTGKHRLPKMITEVPFKKVTNWPRVHA